MHRSQAASRMAADTTLLMAPWPLKRREGGRGRLACLAIPPSVLFSLALLSLSR